MTKITAERSKSTMAVEPIVYVLDDDSSVCQALGRLFRSVGLSTKLFASASELLHSEIPQVPSCLVLDVRLPGLSGFQIHAELNRADIHMPIIFITAHGDIPMSVQAMKAGAVDFLAKPFRDQDVLDAVTAAINQDRARLDKESSLSGAQKLFDSLTPREREVMTLVAAGLLNKQIAADIGVSETTVKVHRMHMMKKMHARSLADLIRIAEALGISQPRAS
jgi:FixJ family two-component response regulator